MQGPVRSLHRNFSHASTTRRFGPLAPGWCPPTSRVEDRPSRPRVPSPAPYRGTGGAAVNCPTTRCSTPAAAPRIGQGESPPGGPNTRRVSPSPPSPTTSPPTPGSHLPISGAGGPLLLRPADASCWPCDTSIAARVDCDPGTIGRSVSPPGGPRVHPVRNHLREIPPAARSTSPAAS